MPKKGKKSKKSQRSGAQRGPGNSPANQGPPQTDSESAIDSQAIAPVGQAADSGTGAPDPNADDQKPKGPSPAGFVQGTKEELAKVVWPDRQQLISESAAVILMVSFLAIFISLIDNVFSWASRLVF